MGVDCGVITSVVGLDTFWNVSLSERGIAGPQVGPQVVGAHGVQQSRWYEGC